MIQPAIAWLDAAEPNSPGGSPTWYLDWHKRAYVDSLYAAATFTLLHRATGNRKYLGMLHAFFRAVTAELLDKQDGLYYRDVRFIGKHTRAGRKIYWSRGNGWAIAAIPRLLESLPRNDPARAEYAEIFRGLAAGVAKRQPADGLWRPNLDDPEDVPMPETSGTGFFVYALAWGIRNQLLDRAVYTPVVRRGWEGLRVNVSPEGQVLWGQQIDGQPNPLKPDSNEEYVTGTFLLAASQIYRGGL
jgi:rhamnogalacturonyl hydrolase YesR